MTGHRSMRGKLSRSNDRLFERYVLGNEIDRFWFGIVYFLKKLRCASGARETREFGIKQNDKVKITTVSPLLERTKKGQLL